MVLQAYFVNPEIEQNMLFDRHVSIQPREVREPINASLQAAIDISQTLALIGFSLIAITMILMLLVIMLGEFTMRRSLTILGGAGMASGILVILLGVVGTASPETLLDLAVPGLFLVESYSAEMMEAFQLFITRLFELLFEMTLYTGGASFFVSLMLFITGKVMPKTAAERKATTSIGSGLPEQDLAPKLQPGTTKFFKP